MENLEFKVDPPMQEMMESDIWIIDELLEQNPHLHSYSVADPGEYLQPNLMPREMLNGTSQTYGEYLIALRNTLQKAIETGFLYTQDLSILQQWRSPYVAHGLSLQEGFFHKDHYLEDQEEFDKE